MGVFRQGRIGVAANRDDLDLKARDRRQNPQQFLGLAARTQGQNGITVRNHSEIAVQRIERVEHDRGRTGAGKSSGNLAADVSRFSHPEHDNFSARINRRFQQFDRVTETFPKTLPQSLQLKDLDFEHACGLFKVVHRNIIEPEHETGQDSSVRGGIVMKKLFAIVGMTLIASAAFAQTYTAPVAPRKATGPQKPPPPLPAREPGGVIPRAVRGGNPLQMLNPRAPARYGTAQQSVTVKPEDPGKWNGIKLFEIYF